MLHHESPIAGRFGALIDRCQQLAGRFCDAAPAALLSDLSEVVADLPLPVSQREQLIAIGVLNQLLARIACVAGIHDRTEIASGFVELAAQSDVDGWCTAWWHVAEHCAIILGATAPRSRLALGSSRIFIDSES
jgi:hypothetical protein